MSTQETQNLLELILDQKLRERDEYYLHRTLVSVMVFLVQDLDAEFSQADDRNQSPER